MPKVTIRSATARLSEGGVKEFKTGEEIDPKLLAAGELDRLTDAGAFLTAKEMQAAFTDAAPAPSEEEKDEETTEPAPQVDPFELDDEAFIAYVDSHTENELLELVAEDAEKAQKVLDAEAAGGDPRKGLSAELQKLIG